MGNFPVLCSDQKVHTGLQSINIPNGVTRIEDSAFYNCSSLKSIVIPNSVTYLGSYAFGNCKSLRDLTLSNRIDESCLSTSNNIYDNYSGEYGWQFANCTSLTSVTIPEGIPAISQGMFSVLY